MSLHSLSDRELFEKIRSLSQDERRITSEVLHGLREVARRRLYAKYGYDSLFSFLVKELRYDEASAYRRVYAIRVMDAVPEVEQALENGKLSIATVAQAQTFFQQEKKRSAPVSLEKKREILKSLEGRSKREAEKILAKEAPETPKPDQERVINENQTEIRFVADPGLLEMLKCVQALVSHKDLEPGYNGLLKFMAALVLKKLDPDQQKERARLSPEKGATQHALSTAPARYVQVSLKREVWKRDQGRCTYVSPVSGKQCGSKYGLQYDHIVPYAKGGLTELRNLRLRCRAHNQLHAVQSFGVPKMARYFKME